VRLLKLSVAVLLLGGSVVSPAQQNCSSGPGLNCPYRLRQVVEAPSGKIDGHNATFALSETPVPGTPVHGFSNGIELVPGQDNQIDGLRITFLPAHVPAPGDVLTFTYYEVAGLASAPVSQNAGRSVNRTVTAPDLEMQLLRYALAYEAGQAQAPATAAASTSALATAPATGMTPRVHPAVARGDESLRMLFRRIQNGSTHSKRVQDTTAEDTEGFEGLGDQGADTIFSLLDADDAAAPNRSVAPGIPPEHANRRAEPESMRMLVARIASSHAQDARPK